MSHIPVLLKEVVEYLDPKPGDFIIDGTIGSGGHAEKILEKIGPKGKLLGIDWDKENIKSLKSKFKNHSNAILVQGNYADLPEILEKEKLPEADGLLIDLGFSSGQLDSGKGFSFQKDEVLDMRYGGEGQTAAEIVNSLSEKDLADIFWRFGEERYSRQIAKKIVEERKKERILMTGRLVEIVKSAVPRNYERGRINPATRVFQALRICVNDELGNLGSILGNLESILKNKGRVAIISFHSLEDRMVKNHFRQAAKEGKMSILTKRPVTASEEEAEINPRSRSAKMRAAEIIK
jgi:16S rRNA (cytosine1402-N4)-methyltransferase